ncbi:hypothetical protein BDR22DRAFT_845478 [Usnea florida]
MKAVRVLTTVVASLLIGTVYNHNAFTISTVIGQSRIVRIQIPSKKSYIIVNLNGVRLAKKLANHVRSTTIDAGQLSMQKSLLRLLLMCARFLVETAPQPCRSRYSNR